MSVEIRDLSIGQRVRLEAGEEGEIKDIDYDGHVVYVAVPTRLGEEIVDVDPDEEWFEVIA